ncbi:hypothetical protein [Aneurinibacillus tyrosinisolvens]|uniref:hypothetical protein n=1 Tax=Aneurinibacillus tyrosinisolvens TaxID=1443435 RepID=UPI00063EF251|nr:hypothetical protein [Aneurinibacillus tyrosinisolvens]
MKSEAELKKSAKGGLIYTVTMLLVLSSFSVMHSAEAAPPSVKSYQDAVQAVNQDRDYCLKVAVKQKRFKSYNPDANIVKACEEKYKKSSILERIKKSFRLK